MSKLFAALLEIFHVIVFIKANKIIFKSVFIAKFLDTLATKFLSMQ